MEINAYQKADKLDTLSSYHESKVVNTKNSISAAIPVRQVEPKLEEFNEKIPVLPANFSSEINFDKDLGLIVVNIMDKESGEVIRSIPTDEMLQFMRRMNEMFQDDKSAGMLVDFKV